MKIFAYMSFPMNDASKLILWSALPEVVLCKSSSFVCVSKCNVLSLPLKHKDNTLMDDYTTNNIPVSRSSFTSAIEISF